MSNRGKIIICSKCGRERKNAGRGLCQSCYSVEYRQHLAKKIICPGCDNERPHYAKGVCLVCYSKAYNATHLAEHAAHERKRRKVHNAHVRALDKKRRQSPDRILWRRAHREKWYAANRERALKYQSDYRRADPERRDNYKRRRRARVQGLPDTLTVAQWHAILEAHNHACVYCGVTGIAFHREHKIPASKGGGYTAENIVPACPTCNLRKKDMTDTEFREYLKLYPR